MKEADRLARYSYYPLLWIVHEKEALVVGLSAVALTLTNVLGRTHEPWSAIFFLYAVMLGFLLLKRLFMYAWLQSKVNKMNRGVVQVELTPQGVRFYGPGDQIKLGRWDTYVDTRVGKRVLLIYYIPKKASWYRRRKYFIVPLQGLSQGDRNDLLLRIPEKQRGMTVREELATWRLM